MNIAERITVSEYAFGITKWEVDGMAISQADVIEDRPGQPVVYFVKDLQAGYTTRVTGTANARRMAEKLAKAYLFDVIALFGTERLPETCDHTKFSTSWDTCEAHEDCIAKTCDNCNATLGHEL